MIEYFEQGSPEWFEARKGKPSASNFGKIYTATGQLSRQAKGYMISLLAEKHAGKGEGFSSQWTERGIELEAEARDYYEFITGNTVDQVGLVYLDENKRVAGSPDGLIGKDGGLEIKCLKPENHVKVYLDGKMPTEHIPQVQGNMWVSGRKWWDFLAYNDKFKSLIVRVNRDDEYINELNKAVHQFLIDMDELEKQII